MKTMVIKNQYDGPKPVPKKVAPATFSLDYVNSGDATEIDTGIRETIRGIRLSILAMGVGLAKIKAKGLYIDLRYHSMAKYIEALCEETQMERSSIHNWLYIGEAYINYQKDLEKIGFSDADGPTKLPYVERALAVYQKKDVFKAVKEMSLRQFIAFSRGEAPGPQPESKVWVKGNQLFIGEQPAVTLDAGLDSKTRTYLERVLVEAGKALEAGEVILPVRLYDMGELHRFSRAADRMLKEMRGRQ